MESSVVPDSRPPPRPVLTLRSPLVTSFVVGRSSDAAFGSPPARPVGSAPGRTPGSLGTVDDGTEILEREAALWETSTARAGVP